MPKNINHVQHIKSSVVVEGKPKLPQSGILVEGELAVNYASGYETISLENSSGNIVTFSSDEYYTEQKLGSGFTGANSAITVTDVIKENELIISSSINDLNERKADVSAVTSVNDALTAHTANTNIHLTSTEKTNIDSLATNIAAISGITNTKVSNWNTAYTNNHTHSNKSYLDGITGAVGTMTYQNANSYSSATQVQTALNSKANTATTLAGYGITDAYTKSETSGKTEISDALSGKVDATEYATFSASTNDSIDDLSGQSQTIATALVNLNTALNDLNDGIDDIPKFEEITYGDLVTLRSNSGLIPGQWYRITDYQCTTTQGNTQSAGHQFDIIVRADSTDTLNENAYAAKHAGDTYFANSKLEAWRLLYCLDNIAWSLRPMTVATCEGGYYKFVESGTIEVDGDTYVLWKGNGNFQDDWCDYAISEDAEEGTTLYAMYDIDEPEFSDDSVGEIEDKIEYTGYGKGTITWMKDEFGNELSYDFKNIQFKRFYTTDAKGRDGIDSCYMVADPNNPAKDLSVDDTDNFIWAYTFSSNREGGTQTDTSLAGSITNNVIGSNGDSLPNNVFYGMSIYSNTFGDYCYNNSIGNYFQRNTIGNNVYNNTIGNGFQDNSIGNNCYYNTIGNYFRYNTIGNYFNNNSIGNYFQYNTIGNEFNNNSIGNEFDYNSIGNDCYDNSIGNSIGSNTIGEWFYRNTIGESFYQNSIGNGFNNNSIGNDCYQNSIGNNCRNNTIGNNMYNNTIGNYFQYNTIGNYFQYNTIGNGCNKIKIQKDYVYFIVIENGNQYINITSTKTTSSSQVLRNFTVAQGVNNSNSTKTISHNTTNDTFKTIYKPVNSVEVSV